MPIIKPYYYIIALVLLQFTSCVKKELADMIPATQIKTTIDWSEINTSNRNTVILCVGDEIINITEGEQPDPDTLSVNAGSVNVRMYNTPYSIMVMNDILANVTTDAGGYILPNPDPFYSASLDINAEKEKTTNAEITPKYKTRNLIIKFNVPDSIRIQADTTINSINATLSNVAKSFEIKTETVINSGLSAFTIPARIGQDSCICNYFGFIGNEQTFDIEMLLNYNFKRLISVDVSNLLNDFNTDKAKSKTVTIDWGMIKDQWYNIVPQ